MAETGKRRFLPLGDRQFNIIWRNSNVRSSRVRTFGGIRRYGQIVLSWGEVMPERIQRQ